MKKLKSLFVAAAILAVTTFTFSCADPNAKNPDQNPSNENTTEAPKQNEKQDPSEKKEDVKKTIESEEDLQKAMEELFQEIMAFFPKKEPVGPFYSMRAADSAEAELFEGDNAIEPLSKFATTVLEALIEFDKGTSLELKDSINVKNLSFEKLMKAVDKFLEKEENRELLAYMYDEFESADEIIEDLAKYEFEVDAAELKAKLNECVTLTKLKYSGYFNLEPREFREFRTASVGTIYNPGNAPYELITNIQGILNINKVNEEFGLKVEKLDELLQFFTGNTEAFPVKTVSVEEAMKIDYALFMAPLDGNSFFGDEDRKNEWMAGDESDKPLPDPDHFGINGTVSSKVSFDFETASYTGSIEISGEVTSTIKLFQNIMEEIEKNPKDFPVELFNELGGITVSVKDSEISQSFKLGDLIAMTL